MVPLPDCKGEGVCDTLLLLRLVDGVPNVEDRGVLLTKSGGTSKSSSSSPEEELPGVEASS